MGSPPSCRPECVVSSECPTNRACVNQKCADPCPGICGQNARCETINHSPICSCNQRYTGDPFVRCFEIPGNFSLICSLLYSVHNWIALIMIVLHSGCTGTRRNKKSMCTFSMRPICHVSSCWQFAVMLMLAKLHWNTTQL